MMSRTTFALLALSLFPPQDPVAGRRPDLIWPAGPMEVRATFDPPLDPADARRLAGTRIRFASDPTTSGSRGPDASLRIAAARLEDGGRTLVLATDPHPRDTAYSLPAGGLDGNPGWAYTLRGVEALWTEAEADTPTWSGWWPVLGIDEARTATAAKSPSHARAFALLDRPGRLRLATYLAAPGSAGTVRFESDSPFEGTVDYAPVEVIEADGRFRAEAAVEPGGEPVELSLSVETGRGGKAPRFRVALEPAGKPGPDAGLVLPWVPPALPAAAEAPPPPFDLSGGDPGKGEAVFFGEEAKCSACHAVGGKGGIVGPDLSKLAGEDRARVYRDIAEPSAVIHPEYQPYSVALKDGRVVAGVVRAEGADKVRISDISAQATVVDRPEIAELRPSSTSVMPVGLAGALGEERMRDLIAFLTAKPE
jgi:putative heme-binding domain-containing protein